MHNLTPRRLCAEEGGFFITGAYEKFLEWEQQGGGLLPKVPEGFEAGNPNFRSDTELCLDLSKETAKPSFEEEIARCPRTAPNLFPLLGCMIFLTAPCVCTHSALDRPGPAPTPE